MDPDKSRQSVGKAQAKTRASVVPQPWKDIGIYRRRVVFITELDVVQIAERMEVIPLREEHPADP